MISPAKIALWSLVVVVPAVHAQATLFDLATASQSVTEVVSESISFSPVGVGADGATTYIEEEVVTYAAILQSDTTIVLLSAPVTNTDYYVASASGFFRSAIPETITVAQSQSSSAVVSVANEGLIETCAFGANEHATCVLADEQDSTTTHFTTVSGTLAPIFTLAAAAAATGSTSAPTSSAPAPTSGAQGLAPTLLPLGALVSVFVLFVNV